MYAIRSYYDPKDGEKLLVQNVSNGDPIVILPPGNDDKLNKELSLFQDTDGDGKGDACECLDVVCVPLSDSYNFV